MKPLRVVLAAVVGGIILFVWGAVSHMVLPIAEIGVKPLPAEQVVLPALRAAIPQHGLYVFPGMPAHPTEEEQAEWTARYEAGPRGLLVFDPRGAPLMQPAQLGVELASNVAAAFLAACVIGALRAPVLLRACAGLAFGVVGWLNIDVSYSNWYLFPRHYALGTLIDQSAGWLVAGFAIALVAGRPRSSRPAAPAAG